MTEPANGPKDDTSPHPAGTPADTQGTGDAGLPPHLTTADRFSVTLIPHAHACMSELRFWLGLNKTDIVNRAVTLYHTVEEATRNGGQLALISPTGQVTRIKIL